MKSLKLLAPALLLIALLFSCHSEAQTEYKTEIGYFPEQREGVNDEGYRKGVASLKETYARIKEDNLQIAYADHINIASAFSLLKEPQDKIMKELTLAQEKDLETTAQVFIMAVKSPSSFNLTQQQYDSLLVKFTAIVAAMEEDVFDLDAYVQKGGFNKELVSFMQQLREKDQRYRGLNKDMEKQQLLDAANMLALDSLYAVHGRYIGTSLVGEEFSSTMWAVIQHADLARQEKYLPVVWQAVKEGELHETPFKMLLDRVHVKKYGYQIFGSQSNRPLASEEIIAEVKRKYSLK